MKKIKCDVESCKYIDCKEGSCTLDEIKVSCSCNKDECCCKEETICKNFKEDKKKTK